MARASHSNPKRLAAPKAGSIRVDVKINILHTIADAIYATSAGKVREAVANSLDNGATWVVIVLDQTNRRLSILDDGTGISEKRFKEIFENIGASLFDYSKETKLSYFGLGLISIFQLGKRVKLFTKPKGCKHLLYLEIDSQSIFSEANKERSISELSDFIGPLRQAGENARREASLQAVNSILDKESPVPSPASFTEIIIEDMDKEVVEEIGSRDFQIALRQLLPLRTKHTVDETEPFLSRLTGKKRSELVKLLQNPDYCKTVDIYYGVQEELEDASEITQLWKYFPLFSSRIKFPNQNVRLGVSDDKNFAYYVVYTVAEDLQPDHEKDERETGFWFRNQNFLVKSSDFLDKPGPGRRPAGTIDKPLRNWVFGEVFHRNMNEFLTVSRNDLLYSDPKFLEFREVFLNEVASPVNKAIREIYDRRKPIIDDFITPFTKVADGDGPIAKAEKRLRTLLGKDMEERQFTRKVKEYLAKCRASDIEDEALRVDRLIERKDNPLVVAEDDKSIVTVVPSLATRAGTYEVRLDASTNKVIVDVSPTLFAPRKMLFLGDSYEIFFVVKKDTDYGISINTKDRQIFINPFNWDLQQFSINVLDVYIALEVADAVSKGKQDLKRNFLRLLGVIPSKTATYVAPLGDDLRRSAAYKA